MLLPIGEAVQELLLGISAYYPQIKIGQYQIMPDHVHVIVHTVEDLPKGMTVRRVFRGMKAGVDWLCQERLTGYKGPVFEEGLFDRPVYNEEMLAREVAYIRDNVRRYRARKLADLELKSRKALRLEPLKKFGTLWGLGNMSLLEAPQIRYLQFSRSLREEDWPKIDEKLIQSVQAGVVFVSPFISPFEQRALATVVKQRGQVIRITSDFFGDRYKPSRLLFDPFCEGRVLEISVSGIFPHLRQLSREVCVKMNEIAVAIAEMSDGVQE